MGKSKGQAATESLKVYGLAILTVLVALGVLVYFLSLTSEKKLPSDQQCAIAPGLSCTDFNVVKESDGTGTAEVVLTNDGEASLDEAILVIGASVVTCKDKNGNDIGVDNTIGVGEDAICSFAGLPAEMVPPKGEVFEPTFVFNYSEVGSDVAYSKLGTLAVKIE